MNLSAIIAAIRGAKDAILIVVALILLSAISVQTWRLSSANERYEAYQDKVVASTAKAAAAAATAREKAQEAVIEYQSKSAEAERNYQAGRESAIHAQTTLVSDLRSDRVRLQQQWRGCESNRVREGQAVAGTASGPDAEADLRAEGTGHLVGNADYADGWIVWLQSELIATRELYGNCMVPKEK